MLFFVLSRLFESIVTRLDDTIYGDDLGKGVSVFVESRRTTTRSHELTLSRGTRPMDEESMSVNDRKASFHMLGVDIVSTDIMESVFMPLMKLPIENPLYECLSGYIRI